MLLKKLAIFMIACVLIVAFGMIQGCSEGDKIVEPIVADGTEIGVPLSADEINTLGRDAHEEWLQLNGKVKGAPKTAGMCIQLNVPFYSQRDGSWAGDKLGNSNLLIRDYGCHLTCISMLYTTWGVWNKNPDQLNSWAKSKGYFSGALIIASRAIDYGRNRGVRYIGGHQIYGELRAGRPVIVRTTYGGSHFMIIYGFDGQRFWVKDPLKDWRHQNQALYGLAYPDRPFRVYGP